LWCGCVDSLTSGCSTVEFDVMKLNKLFTCASVTSSILSRHQRKGIVVLGIAESNVSHATMRVLYTFSCNICHMLCQIWQIWRPQLGWDKFWSFCNRSMVECAQWAKFHKVVTVESLFRWGGKTSTSFCSKCIQGMVYQMSPASSKLYRIPKIGLFFSGRSVHYLVWLIE